MTDDQSPEARAEAAARDLADTGKTVTARAIREAAKVRMAVASAAAKAWNDAASEDDHEAIPEVPDDVASRLTVIWADAYRAALAAVTPERDQLRVDVDALRTDVDALRTEVEGLTADVETVETERDTATTQVEDLEQKLTTAKAETEKWSTEAAKHEAALNAVRDQHDKLNERITTLLETQTKRDN